MMDFRTKLVLGAALSLIIFGSVLVWHELGLGKSRIVFCDVGQGDGMLIITPSGKKIIVDGGPGNKILNCLSAKIPFWEKKIDMVVATQPQQDHLEGLIAVLENYEVKNIVDTGVKNQTKDFGQWQVAEKAEGAKIIKPQKGQKYVFDDSDMAILWPDSEAYQNWKDNPPVDLNQASVVARFEEGSFCVYLTGDVPKEILDEIINKKCQVLKVSHHGSRTGMDDVELQKIQPKIAVIQVGAKNQYGHPHKEVLDLLKRANVKIMRTDELGTFEIKSNENGLGS